MKWSRNWNYNSASLKYWAFNRVDSQLTASLRKAGTGQLYWAAQLKPLIKMTKVVHLILDEKFRVILDKNQYKLSFWGQKVTEITICYWWGSIWHIEKAHQISCADNDDWKSYHPVSSKKSGQNDQNIMICVRRLISLESVWFKGTHFLRGISTGVNINLKVIGHLGWKDRVSNF